MQCQIKRIYRPYWTWEEWKNGMYSKPEIEEPILISACVEFMSDLVEFSTAMQLVSENWPNAMQHNLTNTSRNRKSFLGHCACSYAIDCPEQLTRKAWKMLTESQREQANEAAQAIINEWVSAHGQEQKNT
jgi:hypothetical protein